MRFSRPVMRRSSGRWARSSMAAWAAGIRPRRTAAADVVAHDAASFEPFDEAGAGVGDVACAVLCQFKFFQHLLLQGFDLCRAALGQGGLEDGGGVAVGKLSVSPSPNIWLRQ